MSPALIERVVVQSDGVPLFIEELTKAIVERAGQTASEPSIVALPATLQASLLARLDRSAAAKQVAQVGAVFGRDFSRAGISKVANLPETVLNEGLDQLIAAGLVFCRGEGINANYTFKHALIQDAAYDSLLKARRAALHRSIAEVLEKDTEIVTMRPELLGHHFAQAGVIEKAVAYFLRAGEQAADSSAMLEAQAHLMHGLELASAIPDPPGRNLRRAELLLALGNVQTAVRGYGSAEHRDAFAQALAAQRELRPEQPDFVRVSAGILSGVWDYTTHSGKVAAGRDVAAELLDLSLRQNDHSVRVDAALNYGLSCLLLGHMNDALKAFDDAKADCESDDYEAVASSFGVDARSLFRGQWSRVLACAGFPAKAKEQARLSVQNARRREHLPSIAITLASTSLTAMVLRDLPSLQQRASELCQLCREQGFSFWLARGQTYAGWLAGTAGELDRGLALLTETIAYLDRVGILLYRPEALGLLADLQFRSGASDAALELGGFGPQDSG